MDNNTALIVAAAVSEALARKPAPPSNPVGALLRPEWDQRLVVDVALGTPEVEILEAYNMQSHALRDIYRDPTFASALTKMRKELSNDGASFKLKCKLQAEAMLERNWELAHSADVDPKVQRQIIADTVRWAGYDAAPGAGGGGGSAGLSISINLGGGRRDDVATIEGERV